jgi:hypothetical protein
MHGRSCRNPLRQRCAGPGQCHDPAQRYQGTGANLNETVLTPANVNPAQFGKLYSITLDGQSYTQPLYVSNLAFSGGVTHNVVFVATMNKSVYALDADNAGAQLQKLGVDPSDLLIEGRSLNTWQNAQYTAALLRAHPAEQLFLVTSGFHLRRSELYFKRLGLQGQPVRADHVDAMLGLIPVAYNFELADLAVHEYIGVVRYFVYERMGWNAGAEGGRAGSG